MATFLLVTQPGCGGKPNPEKITSKWPMEWKLTDQKGRSIQVMLLGRDDTTVFFEKEKGGVRHSYSIEKLAAFDKKIVMSLPYNPIDFEPEEQQLNEVDRAFLEQRNAEIVKLRAQIENMDGMSRYESNRTGGRSRELARLYERIEKVERSIRDYKWSHKIFD